ncbi:MAG: hypothetical protein FJW95_08825 [Actinobacteria bacterium]|nr:hypothetical protein [Actinomycetota bacterium]
MRRTFWLAAGFGLGLYAGERVRRTVVKLTPETLGDTVRSMVGDAIEAGKAEMQARERSLRETFAAPERERPRLRLASGGAGEAERPGR